MIKNSLYICSILCLVSAVLSSCTEPFDIKTDDAPPSRVLYGTLTNERARHSVMVSSTSPYFDGKSNPGVSGARVQITSSNGSVYDFVENDTVPGLYQTAEEVAGVSNFDYTLSVKVDYNNDGIKETYTATSFMRTPVAIDSVAIKSMNMMGQKSYAMYMYAQDSPMEDYYLSNYKVNGVPVLNSISLASLMGDKMFNGQYMYAMLLRMFGDVNDRDGDRDGNNRVYLDLGDTVTLSFGRIEKGYYNFILQCQNEMDREM
jgi:hypothetical protein